MNTGECVERMEHWPARAVEVVFPCASGMQSSKQAHICFASLRCDIAAL